MNDIIKTKKQKFISLFAILIASATVCIILICLSSNGEAIILSGAGLCILFLLLEKLFSKYSPKALFSKEIKGENIKEGEYEIMKRGSYKESGLRHKQISARGTVPYAPNTRANKKSFHKSMHFNGEIYIKEDNGNVVLINGLYPSHLEIYEEGDILLKPAGTKCPIVISRDADRQPCPICGEINGGEKEACVGCGLEILC